MPHRNKATDKFGKCPECGAAESRIIYGWDGVYYDLHCEGPEEHEWSYDFPKKTEPTSSEVASKDA